MRHVGPGAPPLPTPTMDRFFDSRAGVPDPLVAVCYQDSNPDLARARHDSEVSELLRRLTHLYAHDILDIGCGTGRWLPVFLPKLNTYLGVDASVELVLRASDRAREYAMDDDRWTFQSARGEELEAVLEGLTFDLVIVSGLLIYMDDAAARATLRSALRHLRPNGALYLREPCAVLPQRLTLVDEPSAELGTTYSAVYRTVGELSAMLVEELQVATHLRGGKLLTYDPHPGLRNRAETASIAWLWEWA